MRVIVTGASGLVGTALCDALGAIGHEAVPLRRGLDWDPAKGMVEDARLEGAGAMVHLAGESIASGRWSEAVKRRIRDSRVQGTSLLAQAMARLTAPPRVLVSASAVGWYGDRGDQVLTEDSGPGTGFLADVCREWEAAAHQADAMTRVCIARFGMVLSPRGGALQRMLTPFRLGLGGRLGSGRQWISWIALDDLVAGIAHLVASEGSRGAYNFTSPEPVTNADFTKALGRALGRPTPFPVPAFALRLVLGEMADELLLASTRAQPARLTAEGFRHRHAGLESALRAVIS